jgi:voltage-gated potassium channel
VSIVRREGDDRVTDDEKSKPDDVHTRSERLGALRGLEEWIETPMEVLGFTWLGLLVLELTRGLSPVLRVLTTVIWIIFIAEFALRIALAPDRVKYVRRNWLSALSLVLPALRVLRIARIARVLRIAPATRGLRVVRIVTSVNRSMHALGRAMGRRGLGYAIGLTLIVTLAGAAGMYAFESVMPDGRGLTSYGSALWWTAMIMTTMGSDYWPRTAEGRTLCVLLSIYAFAVFGYVTAALASFFIGRDAARDDAQIAGRSALDALRSEITLLRTEVASLRGEA